MVSFIREGIFIFFHCAAQIWLHFFDQLSNCFADATAMFILQIFGTHFGCGRILPGACLPILKVARSLRKRVICEKF